MPLEVLPAQGERRLVHVRVVDGRGEQAASRRRRRPCTSPAAPPRARPSSAATQPGRRGRAARRPADRRLGPRLHQPELRRDARRRRQRARLPGVGAHRRQLGRFTAYPAQNEQQVVGRDLVLKSPFLQKYVSRHVRPVQVLVHDPAGHLLLPDELPEEGRHRLLLERLAAGARVPPAPLHAQAHPHAGAEGAMVARWNATRYPVFKRNLAYNLAMLEQLARCAASSAACTPSSSSCPSTRPSSRAASTTAIAQYRVPAQALARRVRRAVSRLQPGARHPQRRLPRSLAPGGAGTRDLAAAARRELVGLLGADRRGAEHAA